MESLNVLIEIEGKYHKAGNLISTGREIIFEYDDAYLFKGISLTLPTNKKIYEDNEAQIFFENLLPEANQREIIARAGKLSSANVYGLLKRYGGECAGAIVITDDDTLAEVGTEYDTLNEQEFAELIENLRFASPALKHKGYRLSLAGAQAKTSVRLDNDKIFLPLNTAPSTHIIKSFTPDFPGLPVNEAYCSRLAKACILPVCNADVRTIGGTSALFIERYDRYEKSSKIFRLHQEDFCQALGYSYALKYESEGGPSFADSIKLMTEVSAKPAEDKILLIRWFIFNFLIGNADAHAKNISLLYPPKMNGRVKLAPFYDLVCTGIYKELSPLLAMSVGGDFDPDSIGLAHWERFCADVEIKFRVFQKHSNEIIEQLLSCKEFNNCSNEIEKQVNELIRRRASQLTKLLLQQ